MPVQIVAFSKDRPLQLDATLRSLRLTCQRPDNAQVSVLCFASTDRLARMYAQVQAENPWAKLVAENGFRKTLLGLLGGTALLGFVVDDSLFVRPWDPAAIEALLSKHPEVLGASLRLGRNCRFCYPLARPQRLPPLLEVGGGLLALEWQGGEYDFGYPLEVSSSLYRAADLVPLLQEFEYRNPNELEAALGRASGRFSTTRPVLLCHPQSVAFCAPVNMVQHGVENRAGSDPALSAEALAARFERGERIDVARLQGYTPRACHEEIELPFAPGSTASAPSPASSVVPDLSGRRLGVLLIATNRYFGYVEPLVRSMRQHLAVPGLEVRFFCFTNVEAAVDGVTNFHVEHLPWPLTTLLRYRFFLGRADELAGLDYLLYLDADMLLVDRVGAEILDERVCVRHPGYYASPRAAFTYETDPRSRAYIPPHLGAVYFAGGVQGGRANPFLRMAQEIDAAVCEDLSRNIVARWHDESHLNRFLIDHPPSRVLDPGYCHPQEKTLPFAPRIIALSKDHSAMRAENRGQRGMSAVRPSLASGCVGR